jgi:hypothetical protein
MITIFKPFRLVALYVIVLIITACEDKQNIIVDRNLRLNSDSVKNRIKVANSFIENTQRTYNALLDSFISDGFKRRFLLSYQNKLRIDIILSTTRQSIIAFDTSDIGNEGITLTKYPAQYYYFRAGKINDSKFSIYSILKFYDYPGGAIASYGSVNPVISDGILEGSGYKIVDLDKKQEVLFIYNTHYRILDPNNTLYFNRTVPLCIINHYVSLYNLNHKYEEIATYMFKVELLKQISASLSLKKDFMVNKYLKKDIQNFLSAQAMLESDREYYLPIGTILTMFEDLQSKAYSIGISNDELDLILKYPAFKPQKPTSRFNLKRPVNFMIFWSVVNITIIFSLYVFIRFKHKLITFLFIIRTLIKFSLLGIISFINYELYNNRPTDYTWYLYIGPVLSYLVLTYMAHLYTGTHKTSTVEEEG